MTATAWSRIIYADPEGSSDPTYLTKIGQAFSAFANDPFASNLINQIDADMASRSQRILVSSHLTATPPGAWTAQLTQNAYTMSTNDFVISMIGSQNSQNPFEGLTVDGFSGDFTIGLERTLVHELMHTYTTGSDSGQPNFQSSSGYHYSEEISVFAENLIYRQFAFNNGRSDFQYRLGHLDGSPLVGSGGVTGVGAFDIVYNISTLQLSKASQYVSFKATGWSPSDTLTKTFYVPGTTVLGNAYDHYNLYDLSPGDRMYYRQSDGTLDYNFSFYRPNEQYFSKGLLSQVLAYDPVGAMQAASDTTESLLTLGQANNLTVSNGFLDQFWRFSHDAPHSYVALGAERWVDSDGGSAIDTFVSISGPLKGGDDEYPSVIAIDRSTSAVGTLMLGAAGYENSYVDHGSSVDHLRGSSGDDVIVAGISEGLEYNVLEGLAGRDLLIGRSSWDRLEGGAGNDILVSGGGHDYLDGGAGIDLISFLDQEIGVEVRLDLAYSHTGDSSSAYGNYAKQDIHNIEGVIGSNHNDVLYGRGGTILYGMDGVDTFHLKNGDVAVGGEGADRFHLDVDPSVQTSVLLTNLDATDQIFINGVRYTNGLVFDENLQQFYSSKLTSPAAQFDNYLSKLEFTFGNSTPFLTIYMENYSTGEAGITQNSPYVDFVAMPQNLFAPVDLIF